MLSHNKNLSKTIIFIFLFSLFNCLTIIAAPKKGLEQNNSVSKLAIMTYISNHEQARSVKALVQSIRDLSGPYRESKIYVVLADPENLPCKSLQDKQVELIPLVMDKTFMNYPLAIKAFVAAQVEKIAKNKYRTLVWFDPGVIVLNSLDDLNLVNDFDAAVRPVSLVNAIGISPGVAPNDYWVPIYQETGLDYQKLPTVETIVDEVKIQPYYNCEVYSLNPKLGICAEWVKILTKLLKDENYQKNSCTTFLRKLFLHQAVLSGVINLKVKPNKIKPLPLTSGYPFNQHQQLSPKKQITSFNKLSVVIFDDTWERNPAWMNKIEINEPLKTRLFTNYLNYLKLNDNLYRIEGSCNAYLVTTKDGSVLIDPAGAAIAPEFFKKVIETCPLKAILLTHAHQDHSDDIDKWKGDQNIQVITQRDFKKHFEYLDEFAGLFARRNAIWSGKALSSESTPKPDSRNAPTTTFVDEYLYELGDFHFKMLHTPGETPDHTTIWIPELRAVFVGDNYYEYFINNSTFRGTQIRPVSGYIHALDNALYLDPEYFLMGHGSPIISSQNIQRTVGNFRDALKYIYAETVKGINEGKDVYTLMQAIKLPSKYQIGQYYGKVEWTIRGIYQENVGWFDENPATMYSEPASSVFPDLVELCGADAILEKAESHLKNKEYVKVLHLTEIVPDSDPAHQKAKEIRLKALEALKAGTRNYIERIWLNYGIRSAQH
ncbi:MBL fold metallo-hydrolase [candidate division KSB1 bacterium]|nr:MBL fold metallo-hydrolase [candidate division KSB1 bacterium]